MRYTYHGIKVESGIKLDSALFHPVKAEPTAETAAKPKAARKPATKRASKPKKAG